MPVSAPRLQPLTGRKLIRGACGPSGTPDLAAAARGTTLPAVVEQLAVEVERLRAVIAAHDLCHNLHGKVGPREFAEGCAAEQRKEYGCAWHADEVERLRAACRQTEHDVQQALGAALGYPRYCDAPDAFPQATESDGVCVGPNTAASLADQAAAEIGRLRADQSRQHRETASQIRDIASRIGVARMPESVKDELEKLANQYEFWARAAEGGE